MTQQTEIMLSIAGQTGALASQKVLQSKPRITTHVPIAISITVGTATVVIEGRNSPDDAWTTLTTVSATDAQDVQWMPQMQARLSAATGATVRVTSSTPLRVVS